MQIKNRISTGHHHLQACGRSLVCPNDNLSNMVDVCNHIRVPLEAFVSRVFQILLSTSQMDYFDVRDRILLSKHPRQLKRFINPQQIQFSLETNPLLFSLKGYFVLLECAMKVEIHFVDVNENLVYLLNCTHLLSVPQSLELIPWLQSTSSFATKKLISKIMCHLRSNVFDFTYYAVGLCKSILQSNISRNDTHILDIILAYIPMTEAITKRLCGFMSNMDLRNSISKLLLKYCNSALISQYLYFHKIQEYPVAMLIISHVKNRLPFYDYFKDLCVLLDYKQGYCTLTIEQILFYYSNSVTQQQLLFRVLSRSDVALFLHYIFENPHYFIKYFNPCFKNDFKAMLNNQNAQGFVNLIYCSASVEFKVFCCECIQLDLAPSTLLVDILIKNCLISNFTTLRSIAFAILSDVPPEYYRTDEIRGLSNLCIGYLDSQYPTLRESCIAVLLVLNSKIGVDNLSNIFRTNKIPHFQSPAFVLQCGYELIEALQNSPQTQLDGLGNEAIELESNDCTDISRTWRQLKDIGYYISQNYKTFRHDCHEFYCLIFTTVRHYGILAEMLNSYTSVCRHFSQLELHSQCVKYLSLIKRSVDVNRLDGKYSGLAYLILSPLRVLKDPGSIIKIILKNINNHETNTTTLSLIYKFVKDPKIGQVMLKWTRELLDLVFNLNGLLQERGKLLNELINKMKVGVFESMRKYNIQDLLINAMRSNENSRLLALILLDNGLTGQEKIKRQDFEFKWLLDNIIGCGYSRVAKSRCLAARITKKLLNVSELKEIKVNGNLNFNHFVAMLIRPIDSVTVNPESNGSAIEANEYKIERISWNLLKLNSSDQEDIVMYYYEKDKVVDLVYYPVDYETILEGNYTLEYAKYIKAKAQGA
eukprot:NODE_507_length_7471_cov_0.263158.p1 type:complete len:875 gc:universal NODE_507_length_7471_cov_0.263158:4279-6903(+)